MEAFDTMDPISVLSRTGLCEGIVEHVLLLFKFIFKLCDAERSVQSLAAQLQLFQERVSLNSPNSEAFLVKVSFLLFSPRRFV